MIGLHNDKCELRMLTPKSLFGKKDKKVNGCPKVINLKNMFRNFL